MKKIILYILASSLLFSCSDWLDKYPENSVNADKALKTISGNEATLIAAYSNLQGSDFYGRRMIAALEVMGDNAKIATQQGNVYLKDWKNTPGSHGNNWTPSYQVIRNANFVIEAIDDVSEVLSTDAYDKRFLKGEAYFLRGWQFFDLTRVYSREPNYLVDNFDLGIILQTKAFIYDGKNIPEIEVPRNTVDECYTQIISDLTTAFDLLEGNDILTGRKREMQRATALAAKAMLARVYLYQENFEEAINAATWVINNAAIYGVKIETDDYANIYSPNGPESILKLKVSGTESLGISSLQSIYTNTGLLAPLASDPLWYRDEKKGSGYGDVLFSIAFYSTFEPTDSRLSAFKRVIRASNTTNPEKGIWCFKFNGNNGTFGADDIPIIRLSEMYHIRIEANLRKPVKDEGAALADLTFMRSARNLTTAAGITGQALIDLADAENRKEFLGEGHRFFDLKRAGRDIGKSVESQAAGINGITWDDYRVVARIPPGDVQPNGSNPNLVQNPGH